MSQAILLTPTSGPGSGSVNIVIGGNNITITGDPTIAPIVNVSGTTNHAVQVGNASGSLNSIPVGLSGQVLTAVTGSDPVWAAPSGVASVTGTANQVTAIPTTGAVVVSTPTVFIAPGSIASTTTNAAGTNFILPVTTSISGQIIQAGTRVFHTFGTQNTWVGNGAGNFTLTGNTNVAVGDLVMQNITSGVSNVGIGSQAMSNLNTGSRNCISGFQSGASLTSGSDNSGWGYNCLSQITTGSRNTVLGRNSGQAFTLNDSDNITLGYFATGTAGQSNNLIIGAGTGTGVGQLNKAFISGINGVTSSNPLMVTINSATDQLGVAAIPVSGVTIAGDVGSISGTSLSLKGSGSTGAGSSVSFNGSGTAMTFRVTDALFNTIIGSLAGNASLTGTNNVILGASTATVFTTASRNTCIGWGNLASSDTAVDNICVGYSIMSFNTSGSRNVAIGRDTLNVQTIANDNIAIGHNASQITTGSSIVCIGSGALSTCTTGDNNIAIGFNCLNNLVTGTNNICLGYTSGSNYTSGESSNILIGSGGVASENNAIRIGINGSAARQQNKCFIAGIRGITTSAVDAIPVLISSGNQLGTVSSSVRYKHNIEDMDNQSSIIMQLRPRTFNFNKFPEYPAWGLIAEEVDEIFPQLVVYDDKLQPDTVKYHELIPLMLNEIQKLRKELDNLKEKQCQ